MTQGHDIHYRRPWVSFIVEPMNWIILRGLAREKRHWGKFPQELEQGLGNNTKVFLLDLPGFGTEAERNSPATVAGIVNDLRERFLKQVKENEKWGILAVSLGGMCALHWAAKYPKDFEKIVLINSSVSGLSPLFKRMMPQNYSTVFKIATTPDFILRERLVLEMTTNLKGKELEKLTNKHVEYLKEASPRPRNAVAQIMAAIRFQPPAVMNVPLLVLSSLGDTLVDSSCSSDIARFYQAPNRIHSNANHDLSTDDSPWIIEQLKSWLKQ